MVQLSQERKLYDRFSSVELPNIAACAYQDQTWHLRLPTQT